MPARTERLWLPLAALLLTGGAQGAPTEAEARLVADDEAILGDSATAWQIEDLRFRFTLFEQTGQGFQSKAGRPGETGSEELLVFQPMASFSIRQSERVRHQVVLPVDIVSAASPDALDAISTASRHNEAGSVDVTSTFTPVPETRLSARYGGHVEENFRSVFAGLGAEQSLAEDNTTLAINGLFVFDQFDPLQPDGKDLGTDNRGTVSANLGLTQVLSPTTIAAFSYGATYQKGTLAQTWNSIDQEVSHARIGEVFPRTRWRHAASALIAQHIPQTRSTLKASYRYYVDTFDIRAHTVEVQAFQYFGDDLYLRGLYRRHQQSAASFYVEHLPLGFDATQPRTADSDLAELNADELGLKAVILLGPKGTIFDFGERLDVSYARYFRSNGLDVHFVSMSYGGRF